MKTLAMDKGSYKKNGYQSDDDNVRYKINTKYTPTKSPKIQKIEVIKNEDTEVRYKLPPILIKNKHVEHKPKTKPKIKVNFWSSKQSSSRLHNTEVNQPIKTKSNRRHTVAVTSQDSTENKLKKPTVKVSKRVSFLPSPLFSDNHAPMVTVPDDLTINLNEEEANALGGDFNLGLMNNDSDAGNKSNNELKSKSNTSVSPTKGTKRKRNSDLVESNSNSNQNELEFFTKYVVQKLRKMDTNQRIYSENLINTTLMLGQLGKLNGNSRIADAYVL